MKRFLVVFCTLLTLVFALTACGGQKETAGSGTENAADAGGDTSDADGDTSDADADTADADTADAEETDAAEELKEVTVEEVGTFYVPESFALEESGISEEGLPMGYVSFAKDGMYVDGTRFGKDAYDMVGLSIPETLEEYSQRDGVKSGLPKGTEFQTDSYGNLYAEYVADGRYCYQVLKLGEESCGSVMFTCPEEEQDAAKEMDFALWLSKMQLK